MATVNTYGDISPRTATYAEKRLLHRGQALLTLERFGQVDPQPKNKTKSRTFRRYESLAPATTPLSEGVTPEGSSLSKTDVECILKQYGDFVQLTDVILDNHEDPVLNDTIDNCAQQVAETVELLRYEVVKAGSNVFYANAAASRAATNSPVLLADIRKAVRYLQGQRAMEISRIIKASPDIATEPVGSGYFGVGHTDLEPELRAITGWVPVEKYGDAMKALPGEVGKIERVRFILSPIFTPWLAAGTSNSGSTYLTNGAAGTGYPDVYPLLIFAKDCYGIVPLQGQGTVTPMVVNPKPSDSDKLGQRGHVGWKTMQGAVILNHDWLARIECCARAVPS